MTLFTGKSKHILTDHNLLNPDQDFSYAESLNLISDSPVSKMPKDIFQNLSKVYSTGQFQCLVSSLGDQLYTQCLPNSIYKHDIVGKKGIHWKLRWIMNIKVNQVLIYIYNCISWNSLTSRESSRACLNTSKSSCVTVSLLPTRYTSVFSCLMLSLISVSVI